MHRDEQYVVKDDKIIIVDDFTGRLMFGRRYSDGRIKLLRQRRRGSSK